MNEVRNGVLLIDEIDNGLHFSTQRSLWEMIIKGAEDTKSQIFLTTHSKESLYHLKQVLEMDDFASYRDSVKCFTIR